jgi:esterase/lipase superfamily enzyme
MKKRHELIASAAMGRPIHLGRYGHWGAPLLAFPTAAGMAHEWEAQGMVDALAPLVDAGRLKLYCVESNVAETFTRKERDPAWRIGRYLDFERFVHDELVGFVRADCGGAEMPIAVAGASLGAVYAANCALKRPEVFRWALCLSGRYEIRRFLDGFDSPEVYFCNPLAYAPGLAGDGLTRVAENTYLTLVCGQGAFEEGCIEETHALGDLLAAKGIPCRKDIWGRDVAHDWNWWRRQAVHHIGRRFAG